MTTNKAALNYSELYTFPPDKDDRQRFLLKGTCAASTLIDQADANTLYLGGINCCTQSGWNWLSLCVVFCRKDGYLEIATHLHPLGLQHTYPHQRWSSPRGFCRIRRYRCSTCIVPEPLLNWLVEMICCNCLHCSKSASKNIIKLNAMHCREYSGG